MKNDHLMTCTSAAYSCMKNSPMHHGWYWLLATENNMHVSVWLFMDCLQCSPGLWLPVTMLHWGQTVCALTFWCLVLLQVFICVYWKYFAYWSNWFFFALQLVTKMMIRVGKLWIHMMPGPLPVRWGLICLRPVPKKTKM